jgi:ADP-ribose pyrophosphatase
MADTTRKLLETKRFDVILQSYHTPDGRQHTRETIQHPGAVTIIPLVDRDHVCLVRNYRVAVDQTLVELPAGTLEQGEDPAATAVRELAEETGYRAGRVDALMDFAMSPGILNERMYLYVATDLEPGDTSLDEGEIIDTLIVPWTEAMRRVDAGEIRDAKTLVGLMYYDRLHR